jgi:transposase-like protein
VARRPRRSFTDELKAQAVELVRSSGKSVPEVSRELDLTGSALREWITRAEADAGRGKPGVLTTDEREELRRLRRESRVLREEREILKKAAAFFAKETDGAR